MYEPSIIGSPLRLSRAGLRRLLEHTLRTDAELVAFCLDHFPGTQRLFSQGMDRQQKLNLLLEREEIHHIAVRLKSDEDTATHFVFDPVGIKSHSLPPSSSIVPLDESRIRLGLAVAVISLMGLVMIVMVNGWHNRQRAYFGLTSLQPIFRSDPSGAEIWDLRTGRFIGTTPWPIEPSLLPSKVCFRHPASHDEVLLLTPGQTLDFVVELRPVRSSVKEVCDVPIQIP